jgi:hypothetical protein
MLREKHADTPTERVHAAIEASLRSTEDATQEELDAVWEEIRDEKGADCVEEAVFKLAVDGVRPLFRSVLGGFRFSKTFLVTRSDSQTSQVRPTEYDQAKVRLFFRSGKPRFRKTANGYLTIYTPTTQDKTR